MGNGGAAGETGEGLTAAQREPRASTVSPPPIGGSAFSGSRSSGGSGDAHVGVDRAMPRPIGVQAMDVDGDVLVPPVGRPGSDDQVRDKFSQSSGATGSDSAEGAAAAGSATPPVESGRSKAGQRFPAERVATDGASGAEVNAEDAVSSVPSSVRKQNAGQQGVDNSGHAEGAAGEQAAPRDAADGVAPGAAVGRQRQPSADLRGSMWFAGEAATPAQSSSGQYSSKPASMRAISPLEVGGPFHDDATGAAAGVAAAADASPVSSGVPVGASTGRVGSTGRLSVGQMSALERPGVPAHAQSRGHADGSGAHSGLSPGEASDETGRGFESGANGGPVDAHLETAATSATLDAVRPNTTASSSDQTVERSQEMGRAAERTAVGAAAHEGDSAVVASASAPGLLHGSEALGGFPRPSVTVLGRDYNPVPHAGPYANTSPRGDAAQRRNLDSSSTKGRLGTSSVSRTSDPMVGAHRPEPGMTGFGSSAPRAGVGGVSVGRGAVAVATATLAAGAGVETGATPSSSTSPGQISVAQQAQQAHEAIASRRREAELASRAAGNNFSFFSENGGVAEGGGSAAGMAGAADSASAARASEGSPRGTGSLREGQPPALGQTWRSAAMMSPGGSGSGIGGGGDAMGVADDRDATYKRGGQSPGAMGGGVAGVGGQSPLVSRSPAMRSEVGGHRRVGSGFSTHPPAYGSPPSSAASSSTAAAAAAAASSATALPAVSFSRFRGGTYGSRFNASHSVSAAVLSSLGVLFIYTFVP